MITFPKKQSSTLISTTLLAVAMPMISSGEVLYNEDFESYTAGSAINSASSNWLTTTNTNDVYFEAQDSSSYFGSDNQYGYLADTSITNNQEITDTSSAFTGILSGQINLDFYDSSSDLFNGKGFILRFGSGSGNTNTSFAIYIQNGEIMRGYDTFVGSAPSTAVSYSMNTANTLSIAFNNTAEVLNYNGGTITAYSMDVYLNGELIGDNWGTAGGDAQGSLIQRLGFNAKRSSTTEADFAGTLYLDNISVDSTIAIPESSTSSMIFAVIAGMAAMFVAWHKRKN